MGLFRPARKVTTPNGDYWELYVSKTALPAWKGSDADALGWDGDLVELPLTMLTALWANLILPLARVVFLLPMAVVRGRRSRAVRIEAVQTFPQRQVLLWTTTDVHRERVLDEIAAGLSQGKIARPAGCVYSGIE
jgi:hypothetical protein